MTATTPENFALRQLKLTREVNEAKLSLEVSPASWMYGGYGLQVMVSMENGGHCFMSNKSLAFENATQSDVEALFDKVKVIACERCGKPAFDKTVCNTNRDGLCESCFMDDSRKAFAQIQADEKARMDKLDAKHKANGFTHRMDAWVHPSKGGDDYQISTYSQGEMKEKQIAALLKRKGSAVLNDYVIVKL